MKFDMCSKCKNQFADPKSGTLRCKARVVKECCPVAFCHQFVSIRGE